MVKRKISDTKFNPKKTKYIDIIYSEFDSDPDSEEDPEWLPKKDFISESESETKDCGNDSETRLWDRIGGIKSLNFSKFKLFHEYKIFFYQIFS